MRAYRIHSLKAVELLSWTAVAFAISAAAFRLRPISGHSSRSEVLTIPHLQQQNASAHVESWVDSAFALLSREAADGVAATVPTAARSAPLLRGIVWSPAVGVLLEGAGLPEGGAVLTLHAPTGELRLTAVRGDTAFVSGRDTAWVLVLRSRSQQPE